MTTPLKLGEVLGKAICDAIEADVRRAQARGAVVAAMETPARFNITVAGRKSRQSIRLYVTGVSYEHGDGVRIASFKYHSDVKKAATFKGEHGKQVATQIATRFGAVDVRMEGF